MKFTHVFLLSALVAALLGCSKKEEILEGERIDVRAPLGLAATELEVGEDGEVIRPSIPIKLPKTQTVSAWTHRNGSATHSIQHPALGRELTRLWSVSIGRGNDKRHRISSDPIVVGGTVFTLDSQSRVQATSVIGAVLWSRDLTPPADKPDEASGGGLAYGDGLVFASTGFGELTALNPETGEEVWRQKLDAPISSAPVVAGGLVFVVSRDNAGWAIETKNGRIKWRQQSTISDAGLVGGASPATAGRVVFMPFGSGELISALTRNGLRTWSVAVSGSRRGQARSNIGDITGDPVISGGYIYVANQSGRLAAIERRTGERVWTATEGSYSPVWPTGGSIFMVSDAGQLVRLSARTGEALWAVDLPLYKKAKTRRDAFAHFGPVLAGGRLIVVSSDGAMRSFDPASGDLLSTVDIPSGAASSPAIVNGVLYVLSQNGQLHAFK